VAGTSEQGNNPSGSIKFFGDSCVAEKLEASQEGLSSMELVSQLVIISSFILEVIRDRSQSSSQR
jgi:hypothetical protein